MSQAVAHYLSHVCKLFYLGHELWWLYRSELNHYSSLSLVCWASRPEQILYFAHCIHNYGLLCHHQDICIHTHLLKLKERILFHISVYLDLDFLFSSLLAMMYNL